MSIKKSINSKPNRVALGLKCSECLHFSKGPRKFEKLCAQLGQEPFSDACPEFTPDMTVLAAVSLDSMRTLARIASALTQAQTRLLAFTFRNLDYVKKTGFAFGDSVAFSLDGKDYLENYFRGIVIGASKNGSLIYLASSLERMNSENCFLSLFTKSVFSMEDFAKHRKLLIKKNRITLPEKANSSKKSPLHYLRLTPDQLAAQRKLLDAAPDTYEPPSIDKAPKKMLDEANKGANTRRKSDRRKTPEKFEIDAPAAVDFHVNRYGD